MPCLLPKIADEFLNKLRSGVINPIDLAKMTSEQRHAFLSKHIGEENAGYTNAQFESKLLLKNQKKGFIQWAKSLSGLKPEVKKDILSKIERLEKVLSPSDSKYFLKDLAAQKLGVSVTSSEAAKIYSLSKDAQEKLSKINPNEPIDSKNRLEYGRAFLKLNEYIADKKLESNKTTLLDLKKNPAGVIGKKLLDVSGASKAINASLDFSALLRQGHKILSRHPEIWADNALRSIKNAIKSFGKDAVEREARARLASRPNAINGVWKKYKLEIGNGEESFPTSLPEKIPLFGKLFKASEVGFTTFLEGVRADIFDKLYDKAQQAGIEPQGLGKLVNSLTGKGEPLLRGLHPVSKGINNVLFSPRALRSQFDFLTVHIFDWKDMDPFVRKEAVKNLTANIAVVASVLTAANLLQPGSVEKDPRSSDFGKIKIGNTRFDVSGGSSTMVTLASRLLPGLFGKKIMVKTGGVLKPVEQSYFKNWEGVLGSFFENKLAPAAQVVKELIKGENFNKEPVNLTSKEGVKNVAKNLLLPMPVKTAEELLNDPDSAPFIISMMADALGIGVNDYKPYKSKKGN